DGVHLDNRLGVVPVTGAEKRFDHGAHHRRVGGTPRNTVTDQRVVWNVSQLVEVLLLDVRQEDRQKTPVPGIRPGIKVRHAGDVDVPDETDLVTTVNVRRHEVGVAHVGEVIVIAVIVVAGEPDLFEVVAALHAGGGFAHLLHCRQQQPDQHGNDGDD